MAIAPRNNDRFAATGMKSVADDGLTRLIVGIMKSFRRRRGWSSGAGTPHRPGRWPANGDARWRDDETYFRFNFRMLRNTAVVNLFDGCALSVPCHVPGTAPVGLMIAGTQNDRKFLAIGLAVEGVVRKLHG